MSNQPKMTPNDLLAAIARLERENAELKAKTSAPRRQTLKVSEKGALSVYGFGRFPVTLYRSQWEALLEESSVQSIKQFIKAHEGQLKTKEQAQAVKNGEGDTGTAPKSLESGKAF